MLRRILLLAGAVLVAAPAALVACYRPHDLGVGDTTSSSSAGGSPASSASGAGGGVSSSSGAGGVVEPSGPTRLTVVDGINDYGAVRFCFLPGDAPWPASAGGLVFGTGQVVDLATAVPQGTDVTPWVFAGNLAAVTGMTCSQILSLAATPVPDGGTPPPIVAAELGTIPQVVFASDTSLLLVPTGCMGGAGHDASNGAAVCGAGYTSSTPTTGVVLLAMSRITQPGHLALQVVNASAVMPASDVGFQLNTVAKTQVVIAPALGPGAVAPMPPFTMLGTTDLGPIQGVQVDTYPPGATTANATVLLGNVLAASSIGVAGFTNGKGFAFVAVGSAPGTAGGAFWHPLTYALVTTSP